ncbi:DUF6887 family protein [Pseudocalidococcus azoricus]|uniref:DUF6887 family protein n=1 Tax=Pseudocalidococcus azoricus TaxID=3110322 RepID=UPI00389990B4
MDVCISMRPDFTKLTKSELRVYVFSHRHDEEALQAYLDKLNAENLNRRIYQPQEDVSEAIREYLSKRVIK